MLIKRYFKQLLSFGAVAAMLDYVLFFVLYLANVQFFDLSHKLDFWIPLLFIIMGIYYVRKANGDRISFVQALSVGGVVALVTIILATLLFGIHVSVIDPAYYDESLRSTVKTLSERLTAEPESLETIQEQIDKLKGSSVWLVVWDKAIRLTFFSLIYILVFSVFFRKKNDAKS